MKGNVPQTAIVKAFKMPDYKNNDYIVCDIITDILAAGRSSRFYRNLLMGTGVFTEIDASISGSDEPGFMIFDSKLTDDTPTMIDKALQLMNNEANRLIAGDISEYELTRVINRFESNMMFSSMGFLAKAQALANHEMHNEDINNIVNRYRSVTINDIVRVAKNIFDAKRSSTLVYKSKN